MTRHGSATRLTDPNVAYNYAYLDEQTKRMIRRALLKAVAVPGYQVPFGSREMPLARGWGTGGIQVTAVDHRARRHAEGDRPGRRRHHQCRLDPPLLRPRRRRRDDRGDRRGDDHPDAPSHSRDAARGRPDPRLSGAAAGAAAQARVVGGRDAQDARLGRVRPDARAPLRGHRALRSRGDDLLLSGAGQRPPRHEPEPDPEVRQSEDGA